MSRPWRSQCFDAWRHVPPSPASDRQRPEFSFVAKTVANLATLLRNMRPTKSQILGGSSSKTSQS